MMFTPDPRPRRRIVADAGEWHWLRLEKNGPCRACDVLELVQERPSSLHHLVPRSQGGDDVAENLVPLCGSGTTGHHGAVEGRDREARLAVLAGLTVGEVVYIQGRKGPGWIARHYHGEELFAWLKRPR